MLAPPWSLITPAVTFLDRRKCIRASCWSAWCQRGVKNNRQCVFSLWRTDPPPLSLKDLCMKPQTCCRCESVHFAGPAVAENPLELRRLLPAPGDLSANWLWGSSYSPEAGIPSHTSPQPWADASIVIIWRIWVASELRCGRDALTSRSPRRSRDSRLPAIAAEGGPHV